MRRTYHLAHGYPHSMMDPDPFSPEGKARARGGLRPLHPHLTPLPGGGGRLLASVLMLLFCPLAMPAPALVNAVPVADLLTQLRYSAPATVVGLNQSHINAEVDASVVEIVVRVGDIVEPDAPLVRLDCREVRLALERAEAELTALVARHRLAGLQLARAETLARNKNMSVAEVDKAEAEVAVLEAQTRAHRSSASSARIRVDKCVIRSPFRAVVLERSVQLGELVMRGTELMVLMDIGSTEVSAQVVAEDTESLTWAKQLVLHYAAVDYPLRLRALPPVIDPVTHTLEARLLFVADRPPIGASGRLVWRHPIPALPAELLVERNGRMGVLCIKENKAVFVPIPGALEGRPVPVDLPLDTLIITEGRHAVTHGTVVSLAG